MLKTVTNLINASQIQTPITLPGDVTLSTGNLIIGTSGKGIDFSATPGTGTSELLADYEEGTFTPSVVGSTTAGTASYGRRTGVYTKVGRLVTFSIDLAWNGGTGTGNLVFSGLPFTSTALNNGVGSSFCSFPMTGLNIHSPWMNGPTSEILSFQTPVGGGGASAVPYSGNGDAMLFGSYIV